MDYGSFTIYDDVEFIEFNDATLTYSEVAGPLQTEFAVIDDYLRIEEGRLRPSDLLANDLELNGDPISVTKVNGVSVNVGDSIRLETGSTVTVLAGGQLEFDQAGAYAWLDEGETSTQELTYSATDSSGVERTATVTLVFDGVASSSEALHLENDLVLVTTDASKSASTAVANFNIAKSVVVIDEVYVDPNDPPAGVTIEEIRGDTYIMFGGDDAVILEDISLEAWQYVSAQKAASGDGNDVLNGTDDGEVLTGEGGNDTINPGGGNDILLGGDGDDDLRLGDGNHIVFGGSGNDDIGNGVFDPQADYNGDDILYGNSGDDTLIGREGEDQLYGGTDHDTLSGGPGNDTLHGGSGNDLLGGGTGRDLFDGGEGSDTVSLQNDDYGGLKPGVIADLSTGTIEWKDFAYPSEQMISIENVSGTNSADVILGNAEANHIDGVGGNDTLYGGEGNDSLTDGYGDNELYGEAGNDLLYVSGSGSNLFDGGTGDDRIVVYRGQNTIDGGDGSDTLDMSTATTAWDIDVDLTSGSFGTGVNISSFVSIENVIGTPGDNVLTGDAGANILEGRQGNDTYISGAGTDVIRVSEGDGSDTVADFDILNDQIEINGNIVDPNQLVSGVTLTQTNGDVVIGFGNGDSLTLEGIDLNNWQNGVVPDPEPETPAEIELTGLLPGIEASASSLYSSSLGADKLIDGVTGGNNWTSTNAGADEWYELDLQAEYSLTSVVVTARANFGSRANGAVVTLLDQNREVVHTFDPISGAGNGSVLSFDVGGFADARYVRLSQSGEYFNLSEVQVFAASADPVDGSTAPDPEPDPEPETPAEIELTGLLPGIEASASSLYNSSLGADKLIDGVTGGSNWTSTNAGVDEWYELDLQAEYSLTSVVVTARDSSGSRINGAVITLLDQNREVVHTFDPISGAGNGSVLSFDVGGFADARYVRLSQSGEYFNLSEVQVFAASADPVDGSTAPDPEPDPEPETPAEIELTGLLPGIEASASSLYSSSLGADKLIDGVTGGSNWTSTNAGVDEWYELDLQAAYSLTSVVVTARDSFGSRANGAVVTLLDQNREVVHIFDPISGAGNGSVLSFEVGGNADARYVRLSHSGEYFNLSEVQVFAASADPVDGSTAPDPEPDPEPEVPASVELTGLLSDISISASSLYNSSSNGADKLIDGVTGGSNWSSTNAGADEWYELDLQAEYSLTSVVVTARDSFGSRANGAVVTLLDQNREVVHTFDPISGASNGSVPNLEVDGIADARYVRLSYSGEYFNISEVQVFAASADPVVAISAVEIAGTAASDTLNSSQDNEILTGGAGSDVFVFGNNFGTDVIADFDANDPEEKIDLSSSTEITDFSDLTSNHLSQDGADSIIDDGLGNTIRIVGSTSLDLSETDFVF